MPIAIFRRMATVASVDGKQTRIVWLEGYLEAVILARDFCCRDSNPSTSVPVLAGWSIVLARLGPEVMTEKMVMGAG